MKMPLPIPVPDPGKLPCLSETDGNLDFSMEPPRNTPMLPNR